jgi:hypothetical protein
MDPAIRQGLKVSFLIVAAMMAIALLASLTLTSYDPQLVFASQIAPHLGYRPHHHCLFCGMTHAFMACSRGEFGRAAIANPMGPPLYFLFLLTALVAFATVLRDLARRRRKNEA